MCSEQIIQSIEQERGKNERRQGELELYGPFYVTFALLMTFLLSEEFIRLY